MKSILLLIFLAGLSAVALADSKTNGAELLHRFDNGVQFNYSDLAFQFSVAYEPKADGSHGDDKDAFGILNVTGKDKKIEKRMVLYPGGKPQDFSAGSLCLRASLEPHKSNVLQLKLYKLSCLKK